MSTLGRDHESLQSLGNNVLRGTSLLIGADKVINRSFCHTSKSSMNSLQTGHISYDAESTHSGHWRRCHGPDYGLSSLREPRIQDHDSRQGHARRL